MRFAVLVVAACAGPASAPPDAAAPDLAPRCISPVHDRQWGGAGDDTASVTISRHGGIFVHGSTGGSANDEIDPGTGARGYLERFDGDTRAWSLAPDGINAIDLVALADDDAITFVGRGALGNQLDLVIGDVTPGGEPRGVVERAGLPPSERPFVLLADGDQRTIVGHHDIYVPTNYVESWQDPFVFRWDTQRGPQQGAFSTLSSAEPDIATGATLTADGSLLIAGGSLGGGGSWVRPASRGIEPPVWSVSGALDNARSIRRLPDGDFVIAGTTTHVLGRAALGGQDAFVARLAPDLATTRWITQVGSAVADTVIDLAIDDAGRTWILGETIGDVAGPVAGENDLFVIAFDAGGAERWRVQRGSAGDERPVKTAVDACEHVLVAGASDGALVPGARPEGYDAFVLAIDPITAAR